MRRLGWAFAALAAAAVAQQAADPALLAAVNRMRAVDNHAHPPALPTNGAADTDYDALPCPPAEPIPGTLLLRADNPIFPRAWAALFGAHTASEEVAAKARIQREQGANYPNWVLDKLGIETELANRVAMGPGLAPPRFHWVAFADPLLVPLDASVLASDNPDHKFFFGRETALLQRTLGALGMRHPPATLDAYLREVVVPALERDKAQGAVAVKFEAAYLRPLNFEPPNMGDAAAIYAAGGAPGKAAYYPLQDAIFHAIAIEAGKLGLAVHFHTGFGCGSYFDPRRQPCAVDGRVQRPQPPPYEFRPAPWRPRPLRLDRRLARRQAQRLHRYFRLDLARPARRDCPDAADLP